MTEPQLSSAALEPETIVSDRYRVVDRIGEGGMGVVYRVEHTHMRKLFAMKVLHRELLRMPEVVSRFEREAVLAGSIAHPHVAAATDFGKLPDGAFFLILELVTGKSLRDVIEAAAAEPIEMHRALGIMRGMVAGVAAAHAKGIVHRDLKPENIMLVDRDGNPDFVKVLDFGIAKGAAAEVKTEGTAQPLTQIGTIMGTPQYMAPEQALGNPVDQRSDLYALGVIFHELVAGAPPFTGDALQVLRQHITDAPVPVPPERVVGLAVDVAAVIAKLLAKDPAARYQSASELASALEEPVHSAVVVVPRASSPDLQSRASSPGLAAPAGSTLAGAAGAAVGPEARPSMTGSGEAPSSKRTVPPRAVLALGLGGLVVGLAVIAFALSGASSKPAPMGEVASAAAASEAVASAVPTLTPPPAADEPAAPVPSSSVTAAASAEEDDDDPTAANAGAGGQPGQAAAAGTAAPPQSARDKARMGPKTRPRGRRTGPGGIYIPPPRDWFK